MSGKKGTTPQLVVVICLCVFIAIEFIIATGLPERLRESWKDGLDSPVSADGAVGKDPSPSVGANLEDNIQPPSSGREDPSVPSSPDSKTEGDDQPFPESSGDKTEDGNGSSSSFEQETSPVPTSPDNLDNETQQPPTPSPSDDKTDDSETDHLSEQVNQIMDKLTLEQKIAQMFIITPTALTGYQRVTAAGKVTQDAFIKYPVGGMIYMSPNLINSSQTKSMLENMQKYSSELLGLPIFLGVDEEGGTVARIAGNEAFQIKNIGNMSEIGASSDPEQAREAGRYIGGYLSELGFNLDFAPIADVWSNEKNTVVKYRSFGQDAALVRDMVTAELEGLHEKNILGVVKHFPGHGSTAGDSHKGAAIVDKTLQELKECDLIPFIGAIESGISFLMVGHLSLPQITEKNVPAVLSQEIIQGLLREELGYQGIIITDALDMEAVTNSYSSAQACVLAVKAGADILLMPLDFPAAYQGLLNAVKNGEITEERIDESIRRIVRVKLSKLQ